MADTVFEFRGVDNLVYAEVLVDTKDAYETGVVRPLSPVAEIGRTTEVSSESHYYDNQPMIVINSVGADELTLTVAPLDLETYGRLTGQIFDSSIGSLVECETEPKYFALGYRTKGTDGKYRYVWRYKGQFAIPDETSTTESDSIDTNNMELTFTGISTIHKFKKYGKSAKAMISDERYNRIDFTTFFDEVLTPDTVEATYGTNQLAAPVIYPLGSTFDAASIYVSIINSDGGNASVYYTTDGTTPSASNSELYESPFAISETTTIKAVAAQNGKATSDVTEKKFVKTT